MADKGFTIEDFLPLGVFLNIPPFLGMYDHMSAEDGIATEEIASLKWYYDPKNHFLFSFDFESVFAKHPTGKILSFVF